MSAASLSALRLGLGAQVVDVDIALGVAGDHHHAHADHLRGRRVGAVRRRRDQADVAMAFAARAVIAADRQQAGIFALRAGIRLQRDRVVAGDLDQPVLQLVDHRVIAGGLRRPARTDGSCRTPARSPGSSRRSRSASWCRSRAGSSRGRARGPGRRAGACSAASRSRSGACGRPDGSGSRWCGRAPPAARRAPRARRRHRLSVPPNVRQTASTVAAAVVSSSAMPIGRRRRARRLMLLVRRVRDDRVAVAVDGDGHRVEEAFVQRREAERLAGRGQHRGAAVHVAARWR